MFIVNNRMPSNFILCFCTHPPLAQRFPSRRVPQKERVFRRRDASSAAPITLRAQRILVGAANAVVVRTVAIGGAAAGNGGAAALLGLAAPAAAAALVRVVAAGGAAAAAASTAELGRELVGKGLLLDGWLRQGWRGRRGGGDGFDGHLGGVLARVVVVVAAVPVAGWVLLAVEHERARVGCAATCVLRVSLVDLVFCWTEGCRKRLCVWKGELVPRRSL